jgi:hypothetical protein
MLPNMNMRLRSFLLPLVFLMSTIGVRAYGKEPELTPEQVRTKILAFIGAMGAGLCVKEKSDGSVDWSGSTSSFAPNIAISTIRHLYKEHFLNQKTAGKEQNTVYIGDQEQFFMLVGGALSYLASGLGAGSTIIAQGNYATTRILLIPWASLKSFIPSADQPYIQVYRRGVLAATTTAAAVMVSVTVDASGAITALKTVAPLSQLAFNLAKIGGLFFHGRRRLQEMFHIPHRRPIFHRLDARDSNQYFAKCNEPTPTWGGQFFAHHTATCSIGEAIVGVSMDGRALCRPVSAVLGLGQNAYLKVKTLDYNNSHGLTPDSDQTIGRSRIKFECPRDHYMVGIEAYKEGGYIQSESIACRHSFELAKTPLEERPCRWVSFESGDQRLSLSGGDFAGGSWKGQCKDNDYVGGVSYVGRNKYFGGLLCCSY